MQVEIKQLESFPPNSNPFHHDQYNMGAPVNQSKMLLIGREVDYLILVDVVSGERYQLDIKLN